MCEAYFTEGMWNVLFSLKASLLRDTVTSTVCTCSRIIGICLEQSYTGTEPIVAFKPSILGWPSYINELLVFGNNFKYACSILGTDVEYILCRF